MQTLENLRGKYKNLKKLVKKKIVDKKVHITGTGGPKAAVKLSSLE